jgi:hypothetical protein
MQEDWGAVYPLHSVIAPVSHGGAARCTDAANLAAVLVSAPAPVAAAAAAVGEGAPLLLMRHLWGKTRQVFGSNLGSSPSTVRWT